MKKESFSCCFTGYRPKKFPFPLDRDNVQYKRFENKLYETILHLLGNGCTTFYTGMAMGFDIIAAEAVLFYKDTNRFDDLKLICAIPYIEQASAFPDIWKERYKAVLSASDESILLSDKYYRGCYQKRNEFMVNSTDYVLTWFDGRPGGAKNTINYAAKIGRHIINLY